MTKIASLHGDVTRTGCPTALRELEELIAMRVSLHFCFQSCQVV